MTRAWAAVVGVLVLFSGCQLEGVDLGGSDGTTGTGSFTFTRGFVFIRDGNVFAADESKLSNPRQLTTDGSDTTPAIAPDGKSVVYAHAGTQLLTVATDGSGTTGTVFTADAIQSNVRDPVVSPDGAYVVFTYDKSTLSALGRVNLDGTGFQELTDSTGLSYASPSFYPDGSSVLAIAGDTNSEFTMLEKVDVTSGTTQDVATTLAAGVQSIANRAVISKDGTQVAYDGYLSSDPSQARIFVLGLSGANAGVTNQVTDIPSGTFDVDSYPTWVDATDVGFASNAGGTDQVYVVPSNSVMDQGGALVGPGSQPSFGP